MNLGAAPERRALLGRNRARGNGPSNTRRSPVQRSAFNVPRSTFGFGFIASAAALLLALWQATAQAAPEWTRHQFDQIEMAVPFRIVLYSRNPARAHLAAAAAFDRIRQLNNTLTDYDAGSELSQLGHRSGTGEWIPVSRDLWTILHRGQQLSRQTDGAFDLTVGPAVQLWRKARREQRLPDSDRLAQARASMGWEHLELRRAPRRARLLRPGMRLDAGGIAKGYAADEALKVLRRHGISRAMVAAAGDLAVADAPPDRPGWRIELSGSDLPGAPGSLFIEATHLAVATSGDLFQRLEIDGVRYSHIVDPRTGIGLTDRSLVTVIAPDAITADMWATAMSVLGDRASTVRVPRSVAVRIIRQPDRAVRTWTNLEFNRRTRSHPTPAPAPIP